jgi:hypothetical protein
MLALQSVKEAFASANMGDNNMKLSTILTTSTILSGLLMLNPEASQAAGFVNGDFENGTSSGWTVGGGFRGSVDNATLKPSLILPGGTLYDAGIASSHSSIITAGTVDPNVGAALGSTVYSGAYSWRVEDTTFGGYASAISQQVNNYTNSDIFFAWKSVLLGAHGTNDAATMQITLTDLTTNTLLVDRQYNAASGGGGVDPRFSLSGGNYYTPTWQIEQISIGAALQGHDFLLSVLGSDCEPTGHWGYVYLDGFGSVIPPVGVPEPASMLLMGAGLLGLAAARRKLS